MKLKKILILMVGLLMAMPMFGQKLNSRGEKMVKTLKCHTRYRGDNTNIITFYYDDNDEIIALKLSEKNSYEYVVGIENGQVYTEYYKDGEKRLEEEGIVSITMNRDGNVERYVSGSSDGDSYSFQEYTFYYTTDPAIGKPVITRRKEVTRSSASYFGDNDGASYNYVPTPENEAKRAIKMEITHTYCSLYLIENGYTTYAEADEQWKERRTHKMPVVSKRLNDLNINLYGVLANACYSGMRSSVLLYCSPWLPFGCKYLPSVDGDGYQYAYTEKKGNITTIRKLRTYLNDRNTLYETGDYIEIEYVEE